jgi:hypothetical protein
VLFKAQLNLIDSAIPPIKVGQLHRDPGPDSWPRVVGTLYCRALTARSSQ